MSSPKLKNQPLLYLWRAILRLIKIPGGIPAGYPQDPGVPGLFNRGRENAIFVSGCVERGVAGAKHRPSPVSAVSPPGRTFAASCVQFAACLKKHARLSHAQAAHGFMSASFRLRYSGYSPGTVPGVTPYGAGYAFTSAERVIVLGVVVVNKQ